MARHSPCIGICKLDDATGFCLGCGRTGREIGDWIAMSESQRDAIWAALPQRLAKLSVRVRLLPWVQEELVDWVRDTIVARQGTWVAGVPGAVAEFPCKGDGAIDVVVENGAVTAVRSDGAFRVRINEKVRAFAFSEGGPVVLGLPKGRAGIRSSVTLQSLGPDTEAIAETSRADSLFDIGIGRMYSRFCVRTDNEALVSLLSDFEGRHWSEFMPILECRLIAASPHRVVESAVTRIEVFANLPSAGQSSPNGCHTLFLPEFLKSGDEIAEGLTPPDYAAPVAIFYPNKS
ncbi:MAG: DUF1289 domain-containing protein [Hyphomicrobium sp.]|uniref:DUF1289 domain-containing protein n=1 Tax=Hyphomicrobium sp. TaxID=82 RepID=UPI0039E24C7E